MEVVAALIEGGAQVDMTDNDSRAPLLLAAQEGHAQLVLDLIETYGAKVDQRALDGTTALRYTVPDYINTVRISYAAIREVNVQSIKLNNQTEFTKSYPSRQLFFLV